MRYASSTTSDRESPGLQLLPLRAAFAPTGALRFDVAGRGTHQRPPSYMSGRSYMSGDFQFVPLIFAEAISHISTAFLVFCCFPPLVAPFSFQFFLVYLSPQTLKANMRSRIHFVCRTPLSFPSDFPGLPHPICLPAPMLSPFLIFRASLPRSRCYCPQIPSLESRRDSPASLPWCGTDISRPANLRPTLQVIPSPSGTFVLTFDSCISHMRLAGTSHFLDSARCAHLFWALSFPLGTIRFLSSSLPCWHTPP